MWKCPRTVSLMAFCLLTYANNYDNLITDLNAISYVDRQAVSNSKQ